MLHVVRDKAHARSGAGTGRQTVAKKVLIGRAGFYFINMGGLWLSFFFNKGITNTIQSGFFSVCSSFDCL